MQQCRSHNHNIISKAYRNTLIWNGNKFNFQLINNTLNINRKFSKLLIRKYIIKTRQNSLTILEKTFKIS